MINSSNSQVKTKGKTKTPAGSKNKVIVIGTGVAGMNVVYQLIKSEHTYEITCITLEPVCDYSTCGIPFILEGEIKNFEEIILHKPEFFIKNNVRLLKNTEAIKLDLVGQRIICRSTSNNTDPTEQVLEYDYLVLATGRTAFIPPIQGVELEGVHTLMNYMDGIALYNIMSGKAQAVIIGGGIIGLEVAVAFNAKGIPATVVELAPNILPSILDPDMAQIVYDWLVEKGIEILINRKVERINAAKNTRKVESVTLTDGTVLPANVVLMSTGIKPNSKLALQAGLDIGSSGAIKTDPTMRVLKNGEKINNIFALGDCVESVNFITGKNIVSALASTAIIQALAIAKNIMNNPMEVTGFLNPTVTLLAGLQVGSVGLTSHSAEKAGIQYQTSNSTGKSRARYYPGWKNLNFKFLANQGRLLGAQIIGEEDVKERINHLTLVIQENIKIEKLIKTERAFTPPLALLTDPMLKGLKKLV